MPMPMTNLETCIPVSVHFTEYTKKENDNKISHDLMLYAYMLTEFSNSFEHYNEILNTERLNVQRIRITC